ncbi:MAG: site-specific DNA-methyltransferase [Pikeienuella sp.]|uniref:site-specific DNA-methyltransferase n=1 Tax=Pikeienuella sp. TaxID=2831957 RepID=UPI00391B76B6
MTKKIETHAHAGPPRLNIPTPEMEPFMEERAKAPLRVEYERRNPDLDPQLIWRGKSLDEGPLEAAAPPIYLQEQVHPKALIEDLRAGREKAEDLFAHFGVKEADLEAEVEFYRHPMRWSNRMILGDSLQVMASLAEREGLRGKVQCVYIDPPYGIRFNSNFQWSTTSRDVKDGKLDHLTREPEQVKAFRDTWRDGIHSYLSYLRDRLIAARELLTESGSCFVQIGDENVHRVRATMDEVFGEENFCSLIAYKKTTGAGSPSGSTDVLASIFDYVAWYAKSKDSIRYRRSYSEKRAGGDGSAQYTKIQFPDGLRRPASKEEREAPPSGARVYRGDQLTAQSSGGPQFFDLTINGDTFPVKQNGWKTNREGMKRLQIADRVIAIGRTPSYVRFIDDFAAIPMNNLWDDTVTSGFGPEKTYVVQTHPRVIERCILMTTDPGDLVLDPTCGSGTTAYVAEQWGRRWITVDTSRVALALARARIMGARYPFYLLADSPEGRRKEAEVARSAPSTAPTHGDLRHGFVYARVPHVTLKSIANNAEIDVIWERMQPAVEAARARLNAALKGLPQRFEVENGGRAGAYIDFRAEGEIALPSGEPAPAGGFMEWEIPRRPGTPWPAEHRKLLAAARAEAKTPAQRRKTGEAQAKLNALRGAALTAATLPEEGIDPWPEAAEAALEAFWEARIARQKEIDASIAAKADTEYLFDKPYEDPKRVRVAGPFTVESLSPHRTPAIGPDGELIDLLAASEGRREKGAEAENYQQAILENLKAAGVHQRDREDRIRFTALTPWPGRFVGAEGRYMEGEAERRAAIMIGSEYGTVQRADLVAAAREAIDAGFDVLIACAFNFDAHIAEIGNIGKLPILRARMNPDLHMAGELKAGGGNLFVVFGEPDVELLEEGDRLRVKINGVDVFKPQTGEVDSVGSEGIACWFVDTDYTGESFFVRHAYFLGAGDPYKALKTTLKDEIDREAWESLNSNVSRPFDRPKGGRVAVKAINHLGDEVMKVFEV